MVWCRCKPAGGNIGSPIDNEEVERSYQITNLELIAKVVAVLRLVPSPTLPNPAAICPSLLGAPAPLLQHDTGCFINSDSPDYTMSVSQGTLIDI